MKNNTKKLLWPYFVCGMLAAGQPVYADAVIDWNVLACDFVVEARLGAPPSNRMMALVQTAVFEATNAITKLYPASGLNLQAAPGASVDAAVAAANRGVLLKLLAPQQAAIDTAYQAALAKLPDGPAKTEGVAVGERAAAAVLASRADDVLTPAEAYRPHTTAGAYVPTVIPAALPWPQRKPWLMTSPAQFRPGPPPALTSDVWARDFNEVKALGGKNSTQRTAEQTEIARFWEATLPPVYHGVIRSVAKMPGRQATQNARLFAAVTQAQDDAVIAIFEAKYFYNFWRPVTAIRSGDIDGNDATQRDPSWVPYLDTPMHPEYPCAHCIIAAVTGTVLQAEIGKGPMPTLATTSYTAKGAARSWAKTDDFIQEVANARIYDGVHYRYSTEVGTAMGKRIGALAAAKYQIRAD
jgi:PAP2 superfamily